MRHTEFTKSQVTAYHLHQQHLDERLPAGEYLAVVKNAAIANTPPGAAVVSFGARLEETTIDLVRTALEIDRSLYQTWLLRGAPHIIQTDEASVFLAGLRPRSQQEQVDFIQGIGPGLGQIGMTINEVVNLTEAAIKKVLQGREICSKRDLDRILAAEIETDLTGDRRDAWVGASIYGANQTMGEAMVSFCLRLAALDGLICFTIPKQNEPCFALLDRWLERPVMEETPVEAAGDILVDHYLRIYGPSTPAEFAQWSGAGVRQAHRLWEHAAPAMTEVCVERKTAWILASELDHLGEYSPPGGVRFLPAHDPYLQSRNHDLLLPERHQQRKVWRTAGSPGVVLVDGDILGTWKAQKTGSALNISVDFFSPLPAHCHLRYIQEAEYLAVLRGCSSMSITPA